LEKGAVVKSRQLKFYFVTLLVMVSALGYGGEVTYSDDTVGRMVKSYTECHPMFEWVMVSGKCSNMGQCTGKKPTPQKPNPSKNPGYVTLNCPKDEDTNECPRSVARCGQLALREEFFTTFVPLASETDAKLTEQYKQCTQTPKLMEGRAAFVQSKEIVPTTNMPLNFCAVAVDCKSGAQQPIACNAVEGSIKKVYDANIGSERLTADCPSLAFCQANNIAKQIPVQNVMREERNEEEQLAQHEEFPWHVPGTEIPNSNFEPAAEGQTHVTQ
jgi:hypothetical protein